MQLFNEARDIARQRAAERKAAVNIWRVERSGKTSARFVLAPDGEHPKNASTGVPATFIERVPPPQPCERCGQMLAVDNQTALELDAGTGLYHPAGKLPHGAESQGAFGFGADCAAAVLANGGELVRIKRKASPRRKAKS